MSSVFSIGELKVQPNLMYFGHWGVGLFGFCLASIVRSTFLDIVSVVWRESICQDVKWKKRPTLTPEIIESGMSREVPLSSGGGVRSSEANSENGNPDGHKNVGDGNGADGRGVGGGSPDRRENVGDGSNDDG